MPGRKTFKLKMRFEYFQRFANSHFAIYHFAFCEHFLSAIAIVAAILCAIALANCTCASTSAAASVCVHLRDLSLSLSLAWRK